MRVAGLCALLAVGITSAARAQSEPAPGAESASTPGDRSPNDDLARIEFESGVAATERGDWREAARLFESSMNLAPRVATAFDLVVAYGHLGDPIALLRTTDRLVLLADPERHREQLERIAPLRESALREIATVDLTMEPSDAMVRIDEEHEIVGVLRQPLYLTPGPHRIEVSAEGHQTRSIELTGIAGERAVLHVALEPVPIVAPPLPPIGSSQVETGTLEGARLPTGPLASDTLARVAADPSEAHGVAADPNDARRVAAISLWALGAASWIASVIVEGTAWVEGDRLAIADPMMPGFLSQVASYENRATAAVVLSIIGGALGSAGDFAWPWRAFEQENALWIAGVGAACVVGGLLFFIRPPEPLGQTRVDDSGRAIGALLVSAGASLALAPLSLWIEGPPTGSATPDTVVGGGLRAAGAF